MFPAPNRPSPPRFHTVSTLTQNRRACLPPFWETSSSEHLLWRMGFRLVFEKNLLIGEDFKTVGASDEMRANWNSFVPRTLLLRFFLSAFGKIRLRILSKTLENFRPPLPQNPFFPNQQGAPLFRRNALVLFLSFSKGAAPVSSLCNNAAAFPRPAAPSPFPLRRGRTRRSPDRRCKDPAWR